MTKTYLTIDAGGTNIKYALIDQKAKLLDKGYTPTPDNKADFLAVIGQLVERYPDVSGLALSVPGKVDTQTGTIYYGGALTYLHEFGFKDYALETFCLPAAVQNDGKAAALAEVWQGSLKNYKDGAVIVLGTGVGGGIVLDGSIRSGSHFQAGELSYLMLNPSGLGFDKMSGALASSVGLIERINGLTKQKDLKNGLKAFETIQSGDPVAKALFEEYCRYIAYIILNTHATLDLEIFAIGGGISTQPLLIEEINRQYDLLMAADPITGHTLTRPRIVKTSFENDANLYGALYQLLTSVED